VDGRELIGGLGVAEGVGRLRGTCSSLSLRNLFGGLGPSIAGIKTLRGLDSVEVDLTNVLVL
jgi:hypothetical protein